MTKQPDKQKLKRLRQEAERLNKKYGHLTGSVASDPVDFDVIPTGILSLDYALGTGGWGRGYIVEVMGPEDIGKNSAIAYSAIREAQKMGLFTGIVAVEPNFDPDWAAKHGINNDMLAIARPDDGEDAFNILYDWTKDDLIDLIVFDSIGALLLGREIESDTGAKPSAMGQAGLITWGVKRVAPIAWKRRKVVMFLNQVRDVTGTSYTVYDSPGGHALKHSTSTRIQIRPKNEYSLGSGDDKVVVGRELVAEVKRNKLAEGSKQRALFDFYIKSTDEYGPVGIDKADDLVRVGKKTGIIKGSGWLEHHLFPKTKKGEHKLNGIKAVGEWLK
jgi:recombination protein RecA